MQKVHEGDSGLVFDSHPQDFTTVTYCMDTGLLASGACRAAGRAASGRFWNNEVPTETCSHQGITTNYNFAKVGVTDWKEEEEEEEEKTEEQKKPEEQTPTDPKMCIRDRSMTAPWCRSARLRRRWARQSITTAARLRL